MPTKKRTNRTTPRTAATTGMKAARIYLRVSTDEQDLTRQGSLEASCRARVSSSANMDRECHCPETDGGEIETPTSRKAPPFMLSKNEATHR
jgi:hypothetical protein